MTTASYSYPVVAANSVPGTQHKLRHSRFVLVAAIGFAVLVVGITAITVLTRPTLVGCHFTCGPEVGPRLLSPTAYQSSEFGYRVEYDSGIFSVASQSAAGLSLNLEQGYGLGGMDFTATAGSDVSDALDKVVSGINTNEFQDIREIEPVPGAEIGEVEGVGLAYSATLVPQNGGQSTPVSIVAMAATSNNLTISVLAIGQQDLTQVNNLPIGFADGQAFDGPVTNTIWPR
jgi:hypothetical protein